MSETEKINKYLIKLMAEINKTLYGRNIPNMESSSEIITTIKNLKDEKKHLINEIENIKKELREKELLMLENVNSINKLKIKLIETEPKRNKKNLKNDIEKLKKDKEEFITLLKNLTIKLKTKINDVDEYKLIVDNLEKENEDNEKKIIELNTELLEQKLLNSNLEKANKDKDNIILSLKSKTIDNEEQNNKIINLEKANKDKDNKIINLEKANKDKDNIILTLKSKIEEQQIKIKENENNIIELQLLTIGKNKKKQTNINNFIKCIEEEQKQDTQEAGETEKPILQNAGENQIKIIQDNKTLNIIDNLQTNNNKQIENNNILNKQNDDIFIKNKIQTAGSNIKQVFKNEYKPSNTKMYNENGLLKLCLTEGNLTTITEQNIKEDDKKNINKAHHRKYIRRLRAKQKK